MWNSFCTFAHVFYKDTDILGSTLPITTSNKRAKLQQERRRIVRRRFDGCNGLW